MKEKNQWASKLGFLLATAGSAIGLGNLWKFPYLMGKNGGFFFLIAYLVFVCLLGLPIMMTEMSIGRKFQQNPIHAYEKIHPKAKAVGVIGVLAAFFILSYYSVIGGWIVKYFASTPLPFRPRRILAGLSPTAGSRCCGICSLWGPRRPSACLGCVALRNPAR